MNNNFDKIAGNLFLKSKEELLREHHAGEFSSDILNMTLRDVLDDLNPDSDSENARASLYEDLEKWIEETYGTGSDHEQDDDDDDFKNKEKSNIEYLDLENG